MDVGLVGKEGDLAQALLQGLSGHLVTSYSKEEYNFTIKENVKKLANEISKHEVIICCTGVYNRDAYDTHLINTVGPIYLLELLAQRNSTAHVILVGSHSAMWTSWPHIELSRLSYNTSKQSLESYVTGLEHSKESNLKITLFNPSKFFSTMSNYSGYPINVIVDAIDYIINAKVPPLVYELGSSYDY